MRPGLFRLLLFPHMLAGHSPVREPSRAQGPVTAIQPELITKQACVCRSFSSQAYRRGSLFDGDVLSYAQWRTYLMQVLEDIFV